MPAALTTGTLCLACSQLPKPPSLRSYFSAMTADLRPMP
jgi:hypothetical protein